MTYKEILKELSEVNLENEFAYEFEKSITDSLLFKIKNTNKIYSTASLIRALLTKYNVDSEKWIYWQKVLLYFMAPYFVKDKNNLPNNIAGENPALK